MNLHIYLCFIRSEYERAQNFWFNKAIVWLFSGTYRNCEGWHISVWISFSCRYMPVQSSLEIFFRLGLFIDLKHVCSWKQRQLCERRPHCFVRLFALKNRRQQLSHCAIYSTAQAGLFHFRCLPILCSLACLGSGASFLLWCDIYDFIRMNHGDFYHRVGGCWKASAKYFVAFFWYLVIAKFSYCSSHFFGIQHDMLWIRSKFCAFVIAQFVVFRSGQNSVVLRASAYWSSVC